jgi:hypothetical protein
MFDKIEDEIKMILDNLAVTDKKLSGLSDKGWTERIKDELCTLGHKHKYGVSASGIKKADKAEWLFDLIWADRNDNPWQFFEMPLVVECEWNTIKGVITYDFDKLLVAKARHKLMVFQQENQDNVNNVIASLKGIIKHFKMTYPGERYLLAGYSTSNHKFSYELIVL